jgi:hypothetical protein
MMWLIYWLFLYKPAPRIILVDADAVDHAKLADELGLEYVVIPVQCQPGRAVHNYVVGNLG